MCKGFKQISNDFFESDYWRQSRTYNDCEAVLDIIYQVRFEASEHSARIGGREVTWGQAEWPASVRFLAARWHWSEKKVRVFLSQLRRKEIIETDDSQGVNIIRLKKYLVLPDEGTLKGTTNELIINELHALRAQLGAQDNNKGHSKGTKHNNGDKNNRDSSLHSESLLFDIPEELPFQEFWDLYDKKVDRPKCEKAYAKLSLKDRKAIFEYLPKYNQAQPDKQFRKNPLTFLHNRSWEDELIIDKRYEESTKSVNGNTDRVADGKIHEQSLRIISRLSAESSDSD